MALVTYASSDDEEDNIQAQPKASNDTVSQPATANGTKAESNDEANFASVATAHELVSEAPIVGPALGPDIPAELQSLEESDMIPLSPYTAKRALLRDLTLPTLPNYDIPISPPGSPSESTNGKFKHFLQLKKQGIHFNEKLAKSSALKNPSLMQKLMDFSDIDEVGQYSTTLPKELWNPEVFPEHAHKEELAKSQQRILKKKEAEKRGRDSIDFVPAANSDPPSRSGTPGLVSRSGQKSAAERVMAGLGRSNSPQVQGTKRKSRFDS